MRLRIILIVLSLLAFFSVSASGYLYYASSKRTAFNDADRQATLYIETIKNHLSLFLSENLKSVKTLGGMNALRQALMDPCPERLAEANAILDHFQNALDADVCYLMGREGDTVASSNRNAPDSFVGENYAFRPYFRQAMEGRSAIFMARGITSGKRGVYCSHPVYSNDSLSPLGVVVIKAPIDPLEKEFSQAYEGIAALIDPHGVAFLSNREAWVYRFLWKPSPEAISEIVETRQFGDGPWNWAGLEMKDDFHAFDLSGNEYVMYGTSIDLIPGWSVIHLQNVQAISKKISIAFLKMTGFVILTLCALIGVLVFFLYWKGSDHISQRKASEEALRESEETALALLNAATESALLVDTSGVILALNKPAADRFGRSIGQLIGMCAFNLFPPDVAETRKAHHDCVVQTGKALRYEDERDRRCFDTSLYPVFDSKGKVVRVAIFSLDVTDQKQAEQALRLAKEQLTRYSKELEDRVAKRTGEITGILKYTPAVVYIKDRAGCYTLVNSKFEQIFGISNDAIRGKSDYDVFQKEAAHRFGAGDLKVLKERVSFQAEELISQADGIHTYLSVKFPLYDEKGSVLGLCGIATDITALKKAQDQLRRLSASIMGSQEMERTAIARELHDELGQMLTALRIDSVWMREHLKKNDPKARERALGMCELIDKTIDEVRGMSIRLRPGVLDDLGLIAALEWYTADFEKRTGIECAFKPLNVDRVDDTLATAAYRIAQEALTNVARHSHASHVKVTLERWDGVLSLSVVDNGSGFDAGTLSDSGSLGLAGMGERSSLVGGSLEIHSHVGGGTEILFKVPVPPPEESVH